MLNEDKIKLMAGIAIYEKQEGKKIAPARKYFRSDYIGHHMLRSFFGYSFCYLLVLLVWGLYSFDAFLNMIAVDDLVQIAMKIISYYVTGLIGYLVITCIVYHIRFNRAVRGQKVYIAKLKRLDKRYEFHNKSKELAKEGGHYDGSSRV